GIMLPTNHLTTHDARHLPVAIAARSAYKEERCACHEGLWDGASHVAADTHLLQRGLRRTGRAARLGPLRRLLRSQRVRHPALAARRGRHWLLDRLLRR